LPVHSDFDLLFANQIAVLASIERRARRTPSAWIKALLPWRTAAGKAIPLRLTEAAQR